MEWANSGMLETRVSAVGVPALNLPEISSPFFCTDESVPAQLVITITMNSDNMALPNDLWFVVIFSFHAITASIG